MQNQKGNIVLIIAGIIAIAILAGGVGYFVAKKPAQKEEQKQQKQTNQQQIQQEQQQEHTALTIPEIFLNSDLEFEQKCKTLNGAIYIFDHYRYSENLLYCYIPFNEKYKKFHALELFNSAILIKYRGYIGQRYINNKDYTNDDEIINNNGFIITLGYFENSAEYLISKYIKQKNLTIPSDTSGKKYLVVKGFNESSSIAEDIQTSINNIICKEAFVKPINISNIIIDPETKNEIINNQLLIVFNEDATFNEIFKKIKALNGEIVGCVLSKDYQIEFLDKTFEELKNIKDLLNKDNQIESVVWNSLADPM